MKEIMTPEEYKEWYAKEREFVSYVKLQMYWFTNFEVVDSQEENDTMQAYAEYYHKRKLEIINEA